MEEIITLKEFLLGKLDTYIESHKQVHLVELRAREGAVEALDKRLESMNEFRAQLDKQAQLFVTRDMLESQVRLTLAENHRVEDSLSARIVPMEDFQKSFYVKAISVGVAFTIINVAINYFGLGK